MREALSPLIDRLSGGARWVMAGISFAVLVILAVIGCAGSFRTSRPSLLDESPSRTVTLTYDWRFIRQELTEAAAAPGFDDSAWETVRVPHDWAIAGPFDPTVDGSTGKLPWKGVGWYRRAITFDPADKGKQVYLDFDGVMAFPQVYVNGHLAGGWDYGYLSFRVDATPYVRFDGPNVIAVKADTRKHGSRWYPGAGIYRKVTMTVCEPVHVANWGMYVTTPSVSDQSATVRVRTTVENHRTDTPTTTVTVVLFDPAGKQVALNDAVITPTAGGSVEADQTLTVANPRRWDVTVPNRYLAVAVLREKGRVIDVDSTYFGIRTFEFTANDGFYLNGRRVQIYGVCLHHDLGPLGGAFNTRAMERELEIMQDMGVNAIRTSHNPPAPELLDLCDRMGLVVWDECFDKWDATADRVNNEPLAEFGEKQIRSFVLRDRNHPSIVIWSIGNEIPNQTEGKTPERVTFMTSFFKKYDPTRPVAIADCFPESADRPILDALDLTGWNYGRRYANMREKYPQKPIIYSESASALSTRGFYELPLPTAKTRYSTKTQVDSYDRNAASWSDIPDAEFDLMKKDSFVAGEFVWTGFDYLGEPTPFAREARSSYFGIVDLCGIPKDRFYLYRSYWNPDETTVHILPHWNWAGQEGKPVPVYVYTNGDEAELFLNGVSLGRRKKSTEIKMNPNLVSGKQTSASSIKPGVENAPVYATDNNAATAWTAADSSAGTWWQIDLGKLQDVRHITVTPTTQQRPGQMVGGGRGTAQTTQYTVMTSTDGVTWREAKTVAPDMQVRRYQPSFQPEGQVRYVRVVFTAPGGTVPGIRDVGIYRYSIDEAYYFPAEGYRLMWDDVVYQPGELKTVAYKQGKRIGEATVRTAGAPARIRLTPDRARITADGEDLSYVLVEMLDANGSLCPLDETQVQFAIEGPAEIAGVGNGNPLSFESFQSDTRRLFYGKAMLIVRSIAGKPGTVTITASSAGVTAGRATLSTHR